MKVKMKLTPFFEGILKKKFLEFDLSAVMVRPDGYMEMLSKEPNPTEDLKTFMNMCNYIPVNGTCKNNTFKWTDSVHKFINWTICVPNELIKVLAMDIKIGDFT